MGLSKRRAAQTFAVFITAMVTAGGAGNTKENPTCIDDAMLVFDGSGSMAETGFNGLDFPRIIEARRAIRETLPHITPSRKVGLIVYGPGRKDACANIDLKFPPTSNAAPRIIGEIERLTPSGNTPLTASVLKAAETLNYKQKPGVIVLVTDGKETCNSGTCQIAAELAADAFSLNIHVIGFQVRSEFFAWQSQKDAEKERGKTVARCLADRTGGKYVSTETANELIGALQTTLGCAVIGLAPRAAPKSLRG